MRVFADLAELSEAVDVDLEPGQWRVVTQSMIDEFAGATGDVQWIHVDPGRAKDGPYGTTIAHGFLTLSLLSVLLRDVYRVETTRMGVNYGLDKVRFPAPVRVDSRVRVRASLASFAWIADDGAQISWNAVVEVEGSDKPACVARTISRIFESRG
ncbi:MaoC family dehydratase [Micromonospora sp. HUAS LYJ1]|uniref:MaoC family dehydratase n=1 Tax=Micromonospora sp. HUAS LYJ1 TaxID=3061626 RepID=UPI0026721A10|nr:MaoC family dehydratase [Micromonospora sp. HUAS LYJ1]WKU03527.1 MaoC family dehydratase [Micromonospora sp. HUAS LYJ1]